MATIPNDIRMNKQLIRAFRLNGGLLDKESTGMLLVEEETGLAQEIKDVDISSAPGFIKPRSGTETVFTDTTDIDSLFYFKNLRLGNHLIYTKENIGDEGTRLYYRELSSGDTDYMELKQTLYNEIVNGNFSTTVGEEESLRDDWTPVNEFHFTTSTIGARLIGVTPKNIWGETVELEAGNILVSSGAPTTTGLYPDNRRTDGFIAVKAATAYAISGENIDSAGAYWFFYTATYTYLGNSSGYATTYTTPANTAFVKLVFRYNSSTDPFVAEPYNLQLELGATATAYERPFTIQPMLYQDTGIPFIEGTKIYVKTSYILETYPPYNVGGVCDLNIVLFNQSYEDIAYRDSEEVEYIYTETDRYALFTITETLPGTVKVGFEISFSGYIQIGAVTVLDVNRYYWLADLTAQQLYEHTQLATWFDDEGEEFIYTLEHDNSAHRYISFADSLVGVSENNYSFVWDGEYAQEPEDFPKAKYIGEFRNRVVISGIEDEPTLLKLSHTGDPYLWDPYGAGSNAVELYVSPDDGEPITGHLNLGDNGLLITKRNKLYGLFGYTRSNFTIELLDSEIGTISHDSLQYITPYAYFLHDSGVYRMQIGEAPENISLGLNKIFQKDIDASSIRSWVYKNNYILHFKNTEGTVYTFVFDTKLNSILEWTVNSTTFGGIKSITRGVTYEEFYYITDSNEVRKNDEDSIDDVSTTVAGVIHTVPFSAGLPEVDKDYSDVYVFANSTGTEYRVQITVYINEEQTGIPRMMTVPATPVGFAHRERIVLGRTGRTLSLKFELIVDDHITKASEFALIGFSYTMQPKEVL